MSSGYEKKDVSVKAIAISTLALVVLIVVMVIFVRDYFVFNMENAITDSALNSPLKELLEIQKTEKDLLTHFRLLDKDKGVYQIPIELAMDLVVQDYKN